MPIINIIIITLYLLISVNIFNGDEIDAIKKKVDELKNRRKELYENITDNYVEKPWEIESDDEFSYLGRNKKKLKEVSETWVKYYECIARLLTTLTDGHLPYISLMVYTGATAYLPCNLCLSPDDMDLVLWWYSPSINNDTFEEMVQKDTLIEDEGNVTIYHTELSDSGVYYCQIGDSTGGLVLLEVVDRNEPYEVVCSDILHYLHSSILTAMVKAQSSHGPYPKEPRQLSSGLLVFSQWSQWSECSRCGGVGRRRRYGFCYVVQINRPVFKKSQKNESNVDFTQELFEAFPMGLPCRSQYLLNELPNLSQIQKRDSEIMIALCKVPCPNSVVFEVKARDGRVLESANNTAGVYSLHQKLPAQPPQPVRDIIFVVHRSPANITCPGTLLRDMPFTWKIGTREVLPRELDRSSDGRLFISVRDHVVITSVKYTDSNLYSCWQDGQLAGTVKLEVWEGSSMHWNHHLTLLVSISIVGVTLRVAVGVLQKKKRKIYNSGHCKTVHFCLK